MGTLYSRSIGVIQSKGNYIFPLDNDDMFFDDDVLNIVYNEAYNFNYDIVGFKAIRAHNYKARINEMKDEYFIHSQKELDWYKNNFKTIGDFIKYHNDYSNKEYEAWKIARANYLKEQETMY